MNPNPRSETTFFTVPVDMGSLPSSRTEEATCGPFEKGWPHEGYHGLWQPERTTRRPRSSLRRARRGIDGTRAARRRVADSREREGEPHLREDARGEDGGRPHPTGDREGPLLDGREGVPGGGVG